MALSKLERAVSNDFGLLAKIIFDARVGSSNRINLLTEGVAGTVERRHASVRDWGRLESSIPYQNNVPFK